MSTAMNKTKDFECITGNLEDMRRQSLILKQPPHNYICEISQIKGNWYSLIFWKKS